MDAIQDSSRWVLSIVRDASAITLTQLGKNTLPNLQLPLAGTVSSPSATKLQNKRPRSTQATNFTRQNLYSSNTGDNNSEPQSQLPSMYIHTPFTQIQSI